MISVKIKPVYSQQKSVSFWRKGPILIGVTSGVQALQGVQVRPPGRRKKISRRFRWDEAKMGLNLVKCTPADEIKRYI